MIVPRLAVLCASIALTFAVFAWWPGLDLSVTGWFYDPASGFSADRGAANAARLVVWRLSEALLAAAVAALLLGPWARDDILGVPRRAWAFVTLLYLLGPGLLVDAILKPVWGRARPADVTEFGGALPFTPPHVISGACTRNCSFTAGEVAGAVALSLSAWVLLRHIAPRLSPAGHRMVVVGLALVPVFIAWQRIAAGRHFLSDSLLSALAVMTVGVVLHWAMFRRRRT